MAIHDVECCDFYQIHDDVVKAVKEKMPDDDDLYDLAEIFKVFGDSTRIKILYVLFEAEMCVCDIAPVSYTHLDVYKRQALDYRPGKTPQKSQNYQVIPQLPSHLIYI